MIIYKTGNLLTEDTVALVNTVNCVGVMGRGIALQFKKQFPENFKAYEAACKREWVVPGNMFVYETGTLTNPKYIINFPTKRHWRGGSRLEDIASGLMDLVRIVKKLHITSIALPPLGCGLGGLDWNEVRILIESYLSDLPDIDVIVYEPNSVSSDLNIQKKQNVQKMTPGRAALIELIHRYLSGLLDPFITLLELHKLMYFLQESGETLRLKYVKAYYGPYAENLRHVLHAVEGTFIIGYAHGGNQPDKQIQLVPGAFRDASNYLQAHQQTKQHYERVAALIEGFESPFGLELLATVHWVAVKEFASTLPEIQKRMYSWNDRKKQFSPRHIELAYNILCEKGWMGTMAKNQAVL